MALLRHNYSNVTPQHSEELLNGLPKTKHTLKQLYPPQPNSSYLPKFQAHDLKYALVRETIVITR